VNPNSPLFSNWTDPSVSASETTGHEGNAPTSIAWLVQPYQSATLAVSMEAAAAVDESAPLTYFFRRYATPTDPIGTGDEYAGQTSRTFVDTNVVLGQAYTYTFVVKDRYGNTSVEAPRVTVTIVAIDLNPPVFPVVDGLTIWWVDAPVRELIMDKWYDSMQCSIAVDPEGTDVEYRFRDTLTGYVSPWRSATDPADLLWRPDGSSQYGGTIIYRLVALNLDSRYEVQARDTSPNFNETAWSTPGQKPQQ
jgi:hypothetical protein